MALNGNSGVSSHSSLPQSVRFPPPTQLLAPSNVSIIQKRNCNVFCHSLKKTLKKKGSAFRKVAKIYFLTDESALFFFILQWNLSLRTPHLSITDSSLQWSLGDRSPDKAYLPKTDTSIMRTLIPVPLVSVIKMFDCICSSICY